LINGKRLDQSEIGRLQITETDHRSEYLLLEAGQEVALEGYPSTHPIIKHFPSSFQDLYRETYVSLRMMNRGRDVTNDLIRAMTSSTSTESEVRSSQSRPNPNTNIVFVVHGRNEQARRAMFDFLRAIGLHPLEWSEAIQSTGKPTPYVGEVLDAAFSRAHAVVVLMTPDDEACLREPFRKSDDPPYEIEPSGQARPNVLFEAGMAMGRKPARTILVELGVLRRFSDIDGLHVLRLNNTPQKCQELAQRLKAAGCPVNLEGTDWLSAGDFEAVINSNEASLQSPPNETLTAEEARFAEMLDGSRQLRDHISQFLGSGSVNRTHFEVQNIIIALGALAGQMSALNMKELNERLEMREDVTRKLSKILVMLSYFEMLIINRNFEGAKQEFASYDSERDDK